MLEQQTNRYYKNRYKFTGKELDERTGLYDFGARHYNPSWSVWLSVDPMALERSWLSPYNYVQNNPIVRVDSDGMLDDEWEINKDGKIINRIENKNEDSFHIVDDNGKRIEGKSITFEYGTIKDVRNPTVKIKDKGGNIIHKKLTLFEVNGDENASKMFEFLTAPSSTVVEWTRAKIGTDDSDKNMVGSSHCKSSTPVGHYLRRTKYTLKEVNHNHPSGNYMPSRGDKNGATLYKEANSNVKLNIYTYPNRYSEYDEKGTLDFSDFGPEIEVIGTKQK